MSSIVSLPDRAQPPLARVDATAMPRRGCERHPLRRFACGAAMAIALTVGVLAGSDLPRAVSAPSGHAITMQIVPTAQCGGTPAPC